MNQSKQIQCLATLTVSSDECSLLLNKQTEMSLETLVCYLLEHRNHDVQFDFPSLVIQLEADEPLSS